MFAECCFGPVNEDRVLVAVHVEHIVFVMNLQDLERPVVGTLQQITRSIVVNLYITRGSQGVGLVIRVV